LVGQLGSNNPSLGFISTMGIWGLMGGLGVLAIALLAKERVAPQPPVSQNLSSDLKTLFSHRSWRAVVSAKLLFTIGLNLQLGLSIYYATTVVGSQAAIGPLMLAGALGLFAGVPISLLLLRKICQKTLTTFTFSGAACLSLGFLLLTKGDLQNAQILNGLISFMLGISLPAFGPASPNMVDHVEIDTGRRLMGLGISTLNFSEKVAAGLASGLIGALLSGIGYKGGENIQADTVLNGVTQAIAMGPALFFGLAALVFGIFYPLNRKTLLAMQQSLDDYRRKI
jgi:Na+/melibiose symporter-like transporter